MLKKLFTDDMIIYSNDRKKISFVGKRLGLKIGNEVCLKKMPIR